MTTTNEEPAGRPPGPDQTRQFLDALFGAKEPSENVLIWTRSDKYSAWFADLDKAAAYVHANADRDVYAGVCLSPKPHRSDERLKPVRDLLPA
jgi:hypothetical protein